MAPSSVAARTLIASHRRGLRSPVAPPRGVTSRGTCSAGLRATIQIVILHLILDDTRYQVLMTLSVEDRVEAMLGDLGCRVTGPRREVARLLASKQGSFSAESINEELPDVGRATVYRTIKLLSDAGILCKTTLPDGSPRYSFDHSWHHHHLICSSCETVEEFRSPALERLFCELADEIPGQVLGHRVELYVTCRRCVQQETPADTHVSTFHGR